MSQKKPELSTQILPKVIFFDAMGTLFELKTSVGKIYQQHALKYGVKADDKAIQNAFVQSFKSATPLAFSTTKLCELNNKSLTGGKFWLNQHFYSLIYLINLVISLSSSLKFIYILLLRSLGSFFQIQ